MNLLASFGRGLGRDTNAFAVALSLVTIFAAQLPANATAADNAVALGSDVTFVATADGTPAPTFQWRKNG